MKTIPVAALALLLLAGCVKVQDDPADPTPRNDASGADDVAEAPCVPPEVQPTSGPIAGQGAVSNYPGSFSYSGQTTAKQGKEVYVWENPRPGALVQWGGQSTAGELKLTIQEACGEEVYSTSIGTLSQSGASTTTKEGEPGDWVLTFEFTLFTGQMGLQVTSG